jgi:protease-4
MTLFEISHEAFAAYHANRTKAKEGFDLSEFVNQRQPARVENGIGHVSVYGTLLRDAAPIDKKLGNTDYADVAADLRSVIDQGAKAVVLHVDSGGGTVAGAIEAAEAVENLAVPVVAYLEGLACSAAYKVASGATYIVSTKSAEVGNIGAIMVWADTSAFLAGMGVSLDSFTNDGATLKSTGHLASLTEDQKAFLQESINQAGETFQNHVLANRPGISPECFKAGWYSGSRAVELGLVDEIGTEQAAIQRATELADTFLTLPPNL